MAKTIMLMCKEVRNSRVQISPLPIDVVVPGEPIVLVDLDVSDVSGLIEEPSSFMKTFMGVSYQMYELRTFRV